MNRVILRAQPLIFYPEKLSGWMLAVFDATVGRDAEHASTGHARWHQILVRALRVIADRSRSVTLTPRMDASDRSIRHAKAFFVSWKVDARNAP